MDIILLKNVGNSCRRTLKLFSYHVFVVGGNAGIQKFAG